MKNPKLILAFVAGVAITLLVTGTLRIHVPHILYLPHMSDFSFSSDEVDFFGAVGVLAIVLVIAAMVSRHQAAKGNSSGDFFQFLRDFRASESDRWFGGICGGLGKTTPIPSWVWRLGFAISIVGYGVGLLAYILLWVLVPDGNGQPETAAIPEASDSFLHFLRNLKRSESDRWFGGVCGGLAERTLVPAWVWRLGFVGLAFCYGSGLLIYVLLWIFVPRAEVGNHFTT